MGEPWSVDGNDQEMFAYMFCTSVVTGAICAGTSSANIVTTSEKSPQPNELDARALNW